MSTPWLHQLRFPAALRIGAAEATAPDVEALCRLLEPTDPPPQGPVLDDETLARLATLAWRLSILAPKFAGHASGRSLANRADALVTLVARLGVETTDCSGQDFDPGELWDEVVSDGVAPDGRPFIESMQMPRVRHNGRTLQRGVPIVADRNDHRNTGDPA